MKDMVLLRVWLSVITIISLYPAKSASDRRMQRNDSYKYKVYYKHS